MDRVKRIWYLSLMRAAKVQASLRIRAVSPESPLLAHTSSESRGTFRQKARSLASLNGWACAVKTCRDGMLEDTNLLDGAHMFWITHFYMFYCIYHLQHVALESTFPSVHPSSHSNVGLSIPYAKPCIEVIMWLWYLPPTNPALSSASTFPYTIHYDLVFLSYISRSSNLRQHQQSTSQQ